eukprot:7725300-Pyramimonas_sp.AAC.1
MGHRIGHATLGRAQASAQIQRCMRSCPKVLRGNLPRLDIGRSHLSRDGHDGVIYPLYTAHLAA